VLYKERRWRDGDGKEGKISWKKIKWKVLQRIEAVESG
jgi:hypothetical protein